MTNFLDYHFGGGASAQFGDKFPDITDALQAGAAGASDEAREPSYVTANNAIRTHVPMVPIVHGGSGVAYLADVQGAHASPLSNEIFKVMTPGDRNQFVWVQNGEPGGIYCADETDGEALRVCEQINESLYAYEVGGTAVEPALAEVCEPNAELTQWTCKIRQGVQYHDGATLDANDVVLSYAVQWDNDHPLHKGRDGSFTYFPALFGGLLNPPPEEYPGPEPDKQSTRGAPGRLSSHPPTTIRTRVDARLHRPSPSVGRRRPARRHPARVHPRPGHSR
jgi:ABC-type transport system substrate-binding protein